jgi:hypothetical protein
MPTSETHIDYVAEPRLQQAQAMLDLFEADRQRAAVTLEELIRKCHSANGVSSPPSFTAHSSCPRVVRQWCRGAEKRSTRCGGPRSRSRDRDHN